jgi:hypothetical protein
MVAFCFTDAKLLVNRTRAVLACSGQLCDGLYDNSYCPCVRVTHLPPQVLSLSVVIATTSEELGIRIQPYQSNRLTEALAGLETFEVLIITGYVLLNKCYMAVTCTQVNTSAFGHMAKLFHCHLMRLRL